MIRLRWASAVCATTLLATLSAATYAKPPATPKPVKTAPTTKPVLPSGDSIMTKYVDAIGGAAAWAKINTLSGNGTISLQNIDGTFTMLAKSPAKMYVKQTLGAGVDSSSGTDGTTAWSADPFTGNRVLSGPELTQATTLAVMSLRPDQWKTVYTKAETLGIENVNKSPAYKVRLSPKVGDPSIQYFDVKSGLQVRSDESVTSPQGKVAVTSYYSDYRTMDGIKIPFSVKQVMSLGEIQTTIKEVKLNVPVEDSQFAQPK